MSPSCLHEIAFAYITFGAFFTNSCSLHFSRTASELLIPKDSMVLEEPETEFELLFRPGVFSCPVVFATSFDLFHRCATNPAQVARKLEGTVLHSFAVSNRRNIFVYKDETGGFVFKAVFAPLKSTSFPLTF